MPVDPRAAVAAANNADLYTAMFEVRGLRYERSALAFVAVDPPPPYFGWMVTLAADPGAAPALGAAVAAERHRPGFGVKDSFVTLDAEMLGLHELFSAHWIWAEPDAVAPPPGLDRWQRIDTPDDLARWDRAWVEGGSPSDERQFPDGFLERPDVAFWGRVGSRGGGPDHPGFDAGAVANRSAEVVGLSNVFGPEAMAAALWLCAEFGEGRPVVGYERGDSLIEALAAGCVDVGALRILVDQPPEA